MISVQTNVNSLVAQENLRVNSNFQSQTIQRLTSGYRINQSGDDAAGLAMANKFRSDVAELTQGVRNANDGVAQLQIMDGGMTNIGKILDRLKTLATQSASDSFTGNRTELNDEYQSLVGEIDRQAQTIGLNMGGDFAKSLGIYLGGGKGSTSSAVLSNGSVTVDLSTSTVDAQSLGLTGVRAVKQDTTTVTNDYDISNASTSNVATIKTKNGVTSTTTAGYTFRGAGFGTGVQISVNLNGVGDTETLVNAINAAIKTAAEQPTSTASNFKAANITASMVTDSLGRQQLSFSSSVGAFQVQADDVVANAFMGNLVSTAGTGVAVASTTSVSGTVGTAGSTLTGTTTITVTDAGGKVIQSHTWAGQTVASILSDLTSASHMSGLTAAGITVTGTANTANGLTFTDSGGQAFKVSFYSSQAGADGEAQKLGFATAATVLSGASKVSAMVSNGAYQLATKAVGTTPAAAADLTWTTDLAANEKQTVTINAVDASGTSHGLTVTLGGTSMTSLDEAISTINTQLQNTKDSTLQGITAIKTNVSGVEKLNFISTLSDFSISASLPDTAGHGISGTVNDVNVVGGTISAIQVGSASAADISTASGAKDAVSALADAVSALGTAQGAIGRAQNQLGFAISLANSQISNFSSAQAQIRDADVASEAANLTKASVLQQASIAAMAQANSAPQAVLALLRG